VSWRLLGGGEPAGAPGAWNMGADEALLASAAAGGRPSLRLYAWDGPWLSLGYAQTPSEARLAACAGAGLGVVRRVTGGRAVLHGGDLTYAVAAPDAALPEGLRPSYAVIAEALHAALASLGVDARRSARAAAAHPPAAFDCFEAPAEDELVVDGRKLVGSAQRRVAGALLQHGSVRLAPDPPAAVRAAGLGGGRATSLREEGFRGGAAELAGALVRAFERVLGERLEPSELSASERRGAAERAAAHAADPLSAPAPGSFSPRGRGPDPRSRAQLGGR